jgi:hypothetical protein
MRRFLEDPIFRRTPDGMVAADLEEFRRTHADDLALFRLIPPSRSAAQPREL